MEMTESIKEFLLFEIGKCLSRPIELFKLNKNWRRDTFPIDFLTVHLTELQSVNEYHSSLPKAVKPFS